MDFDKIELLSVSRTRPCWMKTEDLCTTNISQLYASLMRGRRGSNIGHCSDALRNKLKKRERTNSDNNPCKVREQESYKKDYCPTSPFTILEPQNPWIDEFYIVQERRVTDFKALKLWKGSSSGHLVSQNQAAQIEGKEDSISSTRGNKNNQ